MGAGVAGADPILTFSTSGNFELGSLYSKRGIAASVTDGGTRLGIGDQTLGINTFLVYHAQQYAFDLGTSSYDQGDASFSRDLNFGYFTLESTDPNGTLTREKYREFDGAQFTLSVNQITPVVGEGAWTSKLIHGTVWYSEDPSSPGTGSFLSVKFSDPLTFIIPRGEKTRETIVYNVDPTVYMNNGGGQLGQQFGVKGSVSTVAAPLPGVAVLGLSLLGGVGGVRLHRSRRKAA
jgi:hypothetical protein